MQLVIKRIPCSMKAASRRGVNVWSVDAGTRGLQKLHFQNRPDQPRQWFDVNMLLVTCLGIL